MTWVEFLVTIGICTIVAGVVSFLVVELATMKHRRDYYYGDEDDDK